MANLNTNLKEREKVLELFSGMIRGIMITKGENDKNPERYTKEEDISREFKKLSNSKVFENLVTGNHDVAEYFTDGKVILYCKKVADPSNVIVVFGDKVMVA